jgi:hypothetical protein
MRGANISGGDLLDRDLTHAPDNDLDDFWTILRNYFNDLTPKGDKREIAKGEDGNRTKFLKACQSKYLMDNETISVYQLREVFAALQFKPHPSEEMVIKLAKGLEAFTTGDRPTIYYNKILEGPS